MQKKKRGISLAAVLSFLALVFVKTGVTALANENTVEKVESPLNKDSVAVASDSRFVVNTITSLFGYSCPQILSYAWVVTAVESTIATTFGVTVDAIGSPTCVLAPMGVQVILPLTVPTGTTITLPTDADIAAVLSSLGTAILSTGAANGVDINTITDITNAIYRLIFSQITTSTTNKTTWIFGQHFMDNFGIRNENCDEACVRVGSTCDPVSQAQLCSETAVRAAYTAAGGGQVGAPDSGSPCTEFWEANFYSEGLLPYPAFADQCMGGITYSGLTASLCGARVPSYFPEGYRICACNYITPTPTASPTIASQTSCYASAPDDNSTVVSANGVSGNKFTYSSPLTVDIVYEVDFAGGLENCLQYGCKELLFVGILGYDAQNSCKEATTPGLYPVTFSQNLTSEGCYHIFSSQDVRYPPYSCGNYGPSTGYAYEQQEGLPKPAGTLIGSIWIGPIDTDSPSASPSVSPSASPSANPASPSANPSSPSANPARTQEGAKQSRRPHRHKYVSRSPSHGPHKLTKRYPAPRGGISIPTSISNAKPTRVPEA